MPKIGEVRRSEALGYARYNRYIWQACVDCGKERWVQSRNGRPQPLRCFPCSTKNRGRGVNANHWKGGIIISEGYVYIYKPRDPRAHFGGGKYIKRAVLILEEKLGRSLREGYEAHHQNGIRTDDSPENLEEKEHIEHLHFSNTILYKAVYQLDADNNIIAEYSSISEASRKTKIDDGSICNVCKGNRQSAGGFKWLYSDFSLMDGGKVEKADRGWIHLIKPKEKGKKA